jgi:Arc/MetJ family transcription regulator
MKTNIQIDDVLVKEGFRLTGFKTKKDLVNHALSELVRRKNQKRILSLKGKIEWQGDLNKMRESRF